MIETIQGRVTTQGKGSLSINLFYRRSLRGKEGPLFLAEKDEHAGAKVIGQVEVNPATSLDRRMVWSKKRYDLPDGAFLKIQVMRQLPSGTFRHKQHNLYLRMRATAPLFRIGIDLPTDGKSSISRAYFEGRFDVLSQDNVKELGLHLNQSGNNEFHTFDAEGFEDIINIERLEKEIVPMDKPKVSTIRSNVTGKTTSVVRLKRRRKIAT